MDTTSGYNPYNLYVPVGTTVVWTNYDVAHHTVTADGGLFSSTILLQGQSFSFTFTTVGNYPYHCAVHPMMMAVINVVAFPAAMPILVTMTPISPPIVIPAGGGSFQYHPAGTNQTMMMQTITFFTKMYQPNNTLPLYPFSHSGLILMPNTTKGITLSQNVPGTSPAGTYHFVGCVGTNPDTVKGWASFDFTKSAVASLPGDWGTTMLSDWAEENRSVR